MSKQAPRGPPEASREGVEARVRHLVVKLPAGDSLIVSALDLCRSKKDTASDLYRNS
jgi:hypothetical protein